MNDHPLRTDVLVAAAIALVISSSRPACRSRRRSVSLALGLLAVTAATERRRTQAKHARAGDDPCGAVHVRRNGPARGSGRESGLLGESPNRVDWLVEVAAVVKQRLRTGPGMEVGDEDRRQRQPERHRHAHGQPAAAGRGWVRSPVARRPRRIRNQGAQLVELGPGLSRDPVEARQFRQVRRRCGSR